MNLHCTAVMQCRLAGVKLTNEIVSGAERDNNEMKISCYIRRCCFHSLQYNKSAEDFFVNDTSAVKNFKRNMTVRQNIKDSVSNEFQTA